MDKSIMQSREGAKKAYATNIKNNPNFYRDIGRVGGSVKNPSKGFGSNRSLAKLAGIRGGAVSRRKVSKEACIIPGCGVVGKRSRGLCQKHYSRFRRWGNPHLVKVYGKTKLVQRP